jgi:hypothetical protein
MIATIHNGAMRWMWKMVEIVDERMLNNRDRDFYMPHHLQTLKFPLTQCLSFSADQSSCIHAEINM